VNIGPFCYPLKPIGALWVASCGGREGQLTLGETGLDK
jgi:hypothetical protein